MTILTALPVAALRVQYTIARYPLQLIEAQLGTWLPSQAPVRLIYERGFGLLDRTAGRVLGDGDLERRGTALIERSGALARAEKLDAQAARIESRAEDELATKREDTREQQHAALAEEQHARENSREQAQNREDAARRQAQQEEKAAKERADQVAARRVQAAKATRSSEQSRISDAEDRTAAPAQAELADAADARKQAAAKRADADRVEELADTDKGRPPQRRTDNQWHATTGRSSAGTSK